MEGGLSPLPSVSMRQIFKKKGENQIKFAANCAQPRRNFVDGGLASVQTILTANGF